jgi:lysophospholipase L1-like esterase
MTIGAAQAKPIDIVAIGASNTGGRLVGQSRSYPAQLEAMLRQRGYDVRVRNAGVGGHTTDDVLRQLTSSVPRGTEIVVLAPPVGNDFIQARRRGEPLDVRHVEENIEATILNLKARNIAVAYLSLGRDDGRIARKHGVPFCHFPRTPGLYAAGAGPHYTPEGYRQMAARVLPCVERLLPR